MGGGWAWEFFFGRGGELVKFFFVLVLVWFECFLFVRG